MITDLFSMASRGKTTSADSRKNIIALREKNFSIRDIADMLNFSKSTVGDIVKRYKEQGDTSVKWQTGRPKVLNEADKRYILSLVKKNPKISAPALKTEINQHLGKDVSAQTIRRAIHENGYNGRVARKKPFVSDVNRKKRLNFAKEYIGMDKSYWNDVLFSDESKFNLFGSDGRVTVWRKPNQELQKQNLRPTVKHGGGSVMVWGCFSAAGVGELVFIDGIMDQNVYLNLLKQNLKKSAEKLGIGSSFKFYQDNDPKHTAFKVREWLLYNCPKVLKTPPQSPDINPIENLWHYLELQIRKTTISNKNQLKQVLLEEWKKISVKQTQSLVESMGRRLQAVKISKGLPTKY